MKNTISTFSLLILSTFSSHAAFAVPVQCGDVLSDSTQEYKLTADLNCNDTAITINGRGVRLNLDNHSISGNNIGNGIVVNASDVTIIRGTGYKSRGAYANSIQHFINGINLATTASNVRIIGITISNNSNYGLYLRASNNNFINISSVKDNGEKGIYLVDSSGNNITGNTISDNGQVWGVDKDFDDGLNLEGSNNNHITGNTIVNNREDGIELKNSSSNEVKDNISSNNGRDGIFIRTKTGLPSINTSTLNLVEHNTVENNGYATPSLTAPNENSGGSGIIVAFFASGSNVGDTSGNTIKNNIARFNYSAIGYADISDLNTSCVNFWSTNQFVSQYDASSSSCVQ
jgi:parallel beta-helix repeat protein